MLQQTQAATVEPYYRRFLEAFPDLRALAQAPEDEVMARWAGLGYYSRARNLMACAREVSARYGGELPADADKLRELPGFGPYTTAAVASLAFGLPRAVLDGNVIRVLCRLCCLDVDSAAPSARAQLQDVADALLDTDAPGAWNEALMELGALVCRPRQPDCERCPLQEACLARREGCQAELPVKSRRAPLPNRPTVVLVVTDGAGRLLCRRRGDRGMYRGLWELPGLEARPAGDGAPADSWTLLENTLRAGLERALGPLMQMGGEERFRHGYSHFTAEVLARRLQAGDSPPAPGDFDWLERDAVAGRGISARDRRIISALY